MTRPQALGLAVDHDHTFSRNPDDQHLDLIVDELSHAPALVEDDKIDVEIPACVSP